MFMKPILRLQIVRANVDERGRRSLLGVALSHINLSKVTENKYFAVDNYLSTSESQVRERINWGNVNFISNQDLVGFMRHTLGGCKGGWTGGSGAARPCDIFPRPDGRRLYVVSLTIDFGRGGVSEGLWGEGVSSPPRYCHYWPITALWTDPFTSVPSCRCRLQNHILCPAFLHINN